MPGQWFSNRGQIAQLIVGILALILGFIVAWPHISAQMSLFQLWPVIAAPLGAFAIFQAGRRFGTGAGEAKPTVATDEIIDDDTFETLVEVYEPRISVGSFWEMKEVRITVRGLENYKSSEHGERLGVRIQIKGGAQGEFSRGAQVSRVSYNDFLVPLSSSGVAAEKESIFLFGSHPGFIYFSVIRVDHINEPGKEVSFSVQRLTSVNRKRLYARH